LLHPRRVDLWGHTRGSSHSRGRSRSGLGRGGSGSSNSLGLGSLSGRSSRGGGSSGLGGLVFGLRGASGLLLLLALEGGLELSPEVVERVQSCTSKRSVTGYTSVISSLASSGNG